MTRWKPGRWSAPVIVPMVVAMAALLLAPAAYAAMRAEIKVPAQTSCTSGQQLQLTVGLPPDYAFSTGITEAASPPSAVPTGYNQVCVSTTTGTPYQLLNWLENDYLQVAVLPAFAVILMQRDDPKHFARHYLVLDSSPFELIALSQRPLVLSVPGEAAAGPQYFKNLFAAVYQGHKGTTILLPHHLSAAIDVLMTHAQIWANEQALAGKERERFFAALLDSVRFREPLGAGALQPGEYEILQRPDATDHLGLDRDVLVIQCHIVGSYPQLQEVIKNEASACLSGVPAADDRPATAETPRWITQTIDWLDAARGQSRGAVHDFLHDNYDRSEYGSMSRRYFRFTIPELWGVMQQYAPAGDVAGNRDGLALVLTGGGVKAAYQTRLIERLYGEGRLQNGRDAPPRAGSQRVDYVMGTSGGALLGIFVSALDEEALSRLSQSKSRGLTGVLWGGEGARIRSASIFPTQDMLRYGSITACLIVLLLVGLTAIKFFASRYPQVKMLQPGGPANTDRRGERLPWIALMVLAPWILAQLASGRNLEHMPPVTGVFYILMALIALDADQRFVPTARFQWRKAEASGLALVLGLAGLAAIFVSLFFPWTSGVAVSGCDNWAPAVLAGCAGFVLLAAALHAFFARQTKVLKRESAVPLLLGFAFVTAVVFVSYVVLGLGVWLGKAATLELTGSFWVWLLGTTLVVSCILMVLGRVTKRAGLKYAPAASIVGILFSEHPSRAFTGQRRLTRFVVVAVGAWAWWNFLVAPGMYGNCNARGYFTRVFSDFRTGVGRDQDPLPLLVPFVVTATSLEKSQERYFLFVAGTEEERRAALADPVWFKVVSDPRWLVVRNFRNQDLSDVAFASGSPFPVFSSHKVAVKDVDIDERFIDGGFAHNRPLDAAHALGARRALVLNSSPLPGRAEQEPCKVALLDIGELACYLPRLVPYLWERSQAEDQLSGAGMLVASIYPTAHEADWPALTDFRSEVVDRLLTEADNDWSRRIGVVESWGAPTLGDAQLVTVHLEAVRQMLQRKQ